MTPPSPKRPFTKPAKTPPELLGHLTSRGLIIPDHATADGALRNIGYYRLLIYMRPFQTPPPAKRFRSGVTFTDILTLYNFDRALRLLTLDALERVEVALRAAIVDVLGVVHGPHFHCESRHFHDLKSFSDLYTIAYEAKYLAVEHYRVTYDSPPLAPIWAITEALTFGELSKFLAALSLSNRKLVAARFGFYESVLVSWFRSLTYLRNICAHHSRLWNASMMVYQPMAAKAIASDLVLPHKFYARAAVLQTLLRRTTTDNSWKGQLASLLARTPSVNPAEMGFPSDWLSRPLWN